ncbi:hypothetical protein SSBR45G_19560 [Bradyrhizobium sp. SSBR45G]|uniref:cell envelope biogenesis protein TolA n=1 Tax=unclassified Bradyrhizobium TaxID=2631580 RepID=UPI002342A633|nr:MULTISPECIES: cell envelope biogenesis protein TolA [unclassified Bradyrhizobium]GLH77048.1 hypothetical protein SSBR45G_19560 [Bradyrhizobium sp. SSBR45G]GLH83806.1 hypothetical protein SSBR45R_12660 [Bradyrhizobium sp. SSBR45R]
MPRKLKTYQTSLGFYDLGAGSNLFHQGAATETEDPEVVAATMARPGVVLKRPAGSTGRFAEQSELPDLDHEPRAPKKKANRPEAKRRAAPKASVEDSRKAAAQFEREQRRRDVQRRKEEAAREKERARREKMVAKAQASLDTAQQAHDERSGTLEAARRDLEKRIEAEDRRWEAEGAKLRDALRRARD